MSVSFMAAVTIFRDFGAQENKICCCFHFFFIYLPWSDETGCHNPSFFVKGICYAQACTIMGLLWKIRMTFSLLPRLGAVKSTLWKDILKVRCWSTDVTDETSLVTIQVTRALRELLRKGITSHCISSSPIWDCKEQISLEHEWGCRS